MKEQQASQRLVTRKVAATAAVALAMAFHVAPANAQDSRPPQAEGSIPVQTIAAGRQASLDLNAYFSDPDGDPLAYAATVSNVAVATVSVSGSVLTIVAAGPGMAVVTVFASDPGGLSATQRTQVTVEAPNQAPVSVGTIPGQTLGPGQWISLSVASYFRDPEGESLTFSATTSNPGVAGVEVAGDIVTITQTGSGTAIVNAVARDPSGLSAQQSVAVAAGADQVAPAQPQPPAQRAEPVPPQRPQPPAPPATEATAQDRSAFEAPQPDPFPPRLLAGFIGSTGYSLARGAAHVSAGYMGASPLAQVGEFGDISPSIAQASFGVTDDLTVTAGSGFIYYNVGGGDSDLFPYVAPSFRAWHNEQASVAVHGYYGAWLAEETFNYYGGSVAGSLAVDSNLTVHAAGGMLGIAVTIFGETETEQYGVLAGGADFRVTPELGLAAEFRRVGIEDGTNIVTGGVRYLHTLLAAEAGVAYYFETDAEIRPIVSVAYRF